MSLVKVVGIRGYIQTTYLAVYPDKLLLIDSGCRDDVEVILSYITDTLQRPIKQLKTVVVSHMHPDHAGGAELLREKTSCLIVSGFGVNDFYAGLKGRKQHLHDVVLTYYVAHRQGRPVKNLWYSRFLKPDHKLKEGDRVPNFEDWVVLETPGHTNCDLSLWHPDSNQVYTADLVLKIKNKFVSPYLINYPDQYKASLAKVKQLQASKHLLAHGNEVVVSTEEFDHLIDKVPAQPRHMTLLKSLGLSKFRMKTVR